MPYRRVLHWNDDPKEQAELRARLRLNALIPGFYDDAEPQPDAPSHLPDHARLRKRAEPVDTVYVFETEVWCHKTAQLRTVVKIGITNNPERRAREIRCHSPVAVHLAFCHKAKSDNHARYIEWKVHALHRADHSHGEWFFLTVEQARDTITRVGQEKDIPRYLPKPA